MNSHIFIIVIICINATSGKTKASHREYKRYGERKVCPEYKTISNDNERDVSPRRLNASFSKKLTISKLRLHQFVQLFSKIEKLDTKKTQLALFETVHLTPSYLKKKFTDKRRTHRKSQATLHSSRNVRKNRVHYDRNIPVFH